MASFEKSTKGNASFRIDLSKVSPWYYGDQITGDITVNVKNLFYLRGLVLVLRGTKQVSLDGTGIRGRKAVIYEQEAEIISSAVSICGPPLIITKEANTAVRYENTSYSIPDSSPILNITHGKHQFPFNLSTSSAEGGNLPASFRLDFPDSRDFCSISYILELFCFTQGRCELVAQCPVPIGALKPILPPNTLPGRHYEEILHFPDLGKVEVDVTLDKECYSRGQKVKLELNIRNELNSCISGIKAAVTNHALVEGSYLGIHPGIKGKVVEQMFLTRSGDETIIDFSDVMTIEPNSSLKRTYKMEVPKQVWPTYICGTANVHPFWIRCYIDICFELKSSRAIGRPSLGVLVGDDDRGLRIPLYVVDDREKEEANELYGAPIEASGPFMNRGVVTWAKDEDWPACSSCDTDFTPFRRRHHCRGCGAVVCDSCSAVLYVALLFGSTRQRLCHSCNVGLED